MSWVDRVADDFIIITGDGKEYRPLWTPLSKTIEYNIAEFEFPNLRGTLVQRGTPRGRKYELEIFFQGEDHLELSDTFEESANDDRAWIVTHPLYGRIIVQPIGLQIDSSKYNVTRINGTLIETITEENPKTSVDPVDKIYNDRESVDEALAAAYAKDVIPNTDDINALSSNNQTLYNAGSKKVKITENAEAYFNFFNSANSAIINATSEPLAAIRALQTAISYPAMFVDSVKNRFTILIEQFQLLSSTVSNITSRSGKKTYENNAGTIISSMALAASTPQNGDYGNRRDVNSITEQLIACHDQYLLDLDSMQSLDGARTDSFIPDADGQMALTALVNFTISNLYKIALNAKQERSVILTEDSNVILLAHRFYGLSSDDSTIDDLIRNNSIGLNELLQVRKGRTIVYYV
jgi:hypothetical protein